MHNNYAKAYKEVSEILKYVEDEEVKKIPNEILLTFKANMDTNYDFLYDTNKEFEKQELLIETKAILANIFRDYWATPEQNQKIIARQNYYRQKLDEQKREKYNPDNLFKKHTQGKINTEIILYKESFLKKILKRIKRLLKKSNK